MSFIPIPQPKVKKMCSESIAHCSYEIKANTHRQHVTFSVFLRTCNTKLSKELKQKAVRLQEQIRALLSQDGDRGLRRYGEAVVITTPQSKRRRPHLQQHLVIKTEFRSRSSKQQLSELLRTVRLELQRLIKEALGMIEEPQQVQPNTRPTRIVDPRQERRNQRRDERQTIRQSMPDLLDVLDPQHLLA